MRRARRRGGVNNITNTNNISTRPNTRTNSIPYVPNRTFGFKRSGSPPPITKYTCNNVTKILNNSNVYKQFNSKVRNTLKNELCKPYNEVTIELAKEKALKSLTKASFKEFMTLTMNPKYFGRSWLSRYQTNNTTSKKKQ
jgi:hypothetical protein